VSWKLVSEETPPLNREVFAWGPQEPAACILETWGRDGVFVGFAHHACGGVSGVTHWQPIEHPEPPK
jgi:hypothetical protein